MLRVLAIALLLCAGVAAAQPACKVLDPELQGAYVGGCKDGLAEGYGEARGDAQYRGEFKAGRPHGKGEKIWPGGDRYEGDFVEGRKHGTGMYVWGRRSPWAGQRYTGGYANDQRHGYGVYEWPGGERYAGPWENDRYMGAPTKNMIARGRAFAEQAAAVGRVGTRVCRTLEVGIGNRDTIRGTVTRVEHERITVRIDDAGKLDYTIDGQSIAKGALVTDLLTFWVPCR
jgi:hypothetical protein